MTDDDLIQRAKVYAITKHADANHYYGTMPYSYHLNAVATHAEQHIAIIEAMFPRDPAKARSTAIAAAWCHDTIEDARQSYNDVLRATNFDVAEVVFALTNEKGRTRLERANASYYDGIRANAIAVFVKICDRLANVEQSVRTRSRMLAMYRKEQAEFREAIDPGSDTPFSPMWAELDTLFDALSPA